MFQTEITVAVTAAVNFVNVLLQVVEKDNRDRKECMHRAEKHNTDLKKQLHLQQQPQISQERTQRSQQTYIHQLK
jgi:hypothetical protein